MKKYMIRPALETLRGKKDLIGVEIGVYRGDNARYMLDYLNIKELHLVDPWDTIENYYCVKNTFDGDNRVKLYKTHSSTAFNWFGDETLDFVYIDGNHQYEFVMEDIDLWTPKVKKGGLVSGHDFYLSDGVNKAVRETYPDGFNQDEEDWWIIKS